MEVHNLGEKFRETAVKFSRHTAIQHKKENEWRDISYDELVKAMESLAGFLSSLGVEKGDRVAILLENGPEWPTVFFATVFLGAITVPINPSSSKDEIENILANSKPKVVFTGKNSYLLDEKTSDRIPFIKKVISTDWEAFQKVPGETPGRTAEVKIEPHDLATILYTSGTTDKPKGVMLSHRNLASNAEVLYGLNIVSSKDGVLSILPLHHTYPLMITMLLPLLYGGKIVYAKSIAGEDILEALHTEHPSIFVGVPQVFHAFHQKIKETLDKIPFPVNLFFKIIAGFLYLLRHKTGINLSRYLFLKAHKKFGRSMRFFVTGGAKLDENVEKDLFKFGFTTLQGYGLTETSPVLTLNTPKKFKIGSAGMPLPGVEIKVIDKDKKGVGEVIAKGPNIMEGYYKRDDLSAEVIKDGWFYTGDLGYIDKEGFLFLTGRKKDVIVLSSGLNVYPEEIEKAYSKEMPIREICVFEAPSKKETKETNILWAVVVPDLDFFKKYGEVNLRNVLRERFANVSRALPPHKRLMGFSVTLEAFPRTLLGKVKRFAVRETYASKIMEDAEHPSKPRKLSAEDKELMETSSAKKIIEYLKKQTKIKREIVPSDSLELDLSIDSLGRVDLVMGLEKMFGVEINDEVIGRSFTVKDVISGIESLLAEGAVSLSREEKGIAFDSRYWKRVLSILPKKPTLDKIDLKPGAFTWLADFLFIVVFYLIFKIFYHFKVEGKENYPKEGPCILYVNHVSYMDGFLVASAVPRFPRLDLFFLGFRPFFNVAIIHRLVKIGRIIPLDFASHFLEALRSCHYVLKNKRNICFFPEGLRTVDGKVAEFKRGFGILAKETGAKLVPVFLEGAFEAWPRTAKFPKCSPITVRFGKALDAETLEKMGLEAGAKDSYSAICLAAREALQELGDKK